MTSPRELLDAYVEAHRSGEWGERVDVEAPGLTAALRAVLDLHGPSTINAVVMPDGKCSACHLGEPLRVTMSNIWVGYRRSNEHLVHEHADPHPRCGGCNLDTGEPVEWPCPTVQAITTALTSDLADTP